MMDDAFEQVELKALQETFTEGGDLLQALFHFLKLENWQGVTEELSESLPHFGNSFTLKDLRLTLRDIGYDLSTLKLKNKTLDDRLLPVIYIDHEQKATLICKEEGQYKEVNEFGDKRVIDWPYQFNGQLCLLKKTPEKRSKQTWFRNVFLRSKSQLSALAILSVVAHLCMLMTPLYIMFVYDKVLRSHSMTMLSSFITGMMIIMGSYWLVQRKRRKLVADMCAHSIKSVEDNILAKILKLPSSFTEISSVSSQITRVQDYEGITETFAKGLLPSLIDVPFYLLLISIFFFIGGSLVLVPIIGLGLYASLIMLRSLWDKYAAQPELKVDTSWRSFLIESIQKLYVIRGAHFEKPWMKRFSERTAIMVQERYKFAFRNSLYEIMGESILLVVVLMLLGAGVVLITEQTLSVGGLIAGIILIWQVMNPIRIFSNRARQFGNFKKTLSQIDRIDSIEQETFAPLGEKPKIKGEIQFTQVGLRYSNEREPALIGVSFKIEPGELIVMTGPNGCGKSSVIKLLLRLYQQQVGAVTIDSQDIRQIPHNLLRKSIAYAPQVPQFFYGTILQNLKLGNPLATMRDIMQACRDADVLTDIKQLPKGFDTRIRDNNQENLPASFKQRLQLARTLLVDAPIIILDEPASHLDAAHDQHFVELLQSLRGKKTIIMSSHRPSHFEIADQVIHMERGQVKHIDRPHRPEEPNGRVSHA